MIYVTKENGNREPFSEEKLFHSMHLAGIPHSLYEKVASHVKSKLYDTIPTSEIYHHITEFLEKSEQPFSKGRYGLKQALMALGPTGYPFEDFIAKLLEVEGYKTQVRTILMGKCVSHEIDVIAQKNTVLPTKIMVEAKFHNQLGIHTDLHVSLYTKARFEDLKEKYQFNQALLVTNTKVTSDAIAYASCSGMEILSWSYPEGKSLKELIEKHHIYPITTLTTLPKAYQEQLLAKDIVLCRDICGKKEILDTLRLNPYTKQQVLSEVSFLCSTAS